MKKTIATLLLAATLMLTACSNSATPSTTNSETTTETTTEITTTTTEATTTTTTTTSTVPEEDELIPLFKSNLSIDDIKKATPEDLHNFDKFSSKFFSLKDSGKKKGKAKLYQIEGGESFTIRSYSDKTQTIDVKLYFYKAGKDVAVVAEHGNDTKLKSQSPFVPLFYNKTKRCLVGYRDFMINKHQFTFCEKYITDTVQVYQKEYGL